MANGPNQQSVRVEKNTSLFAAHEISPSHFLNLPAQICTLAHRLDMGLPWLAISHSASLNDLWDIHPVEAFEGRQ